MADANRYWGIVTVARFPEQIELQAKLLNYFLGSNKSNINQLASEAMRDECVCYFAVLTRYWGFVTVPGSLVSTLCVLLCFINPILGNHYGPGFIPFQSVTKSDTDTFSRFLVLNAS